MLDFNKKVYVVTWTSWSLNEPMTICGIFATMKDAKKYVSGIEARMTETEKFANSFWIDEVPLNARLKEPFLKV